MLGSLPAPAQNFHRLAARALQNISILKLTTPLILASANSHSISHDRRRVSRLGLLGYRDSSTAAAAGPPLSSSGISLEAGRSGDTSCLIKFSSRSSLWGYGLSMPTFLVLRIYLLLFSGDGERAEWNRFLHGGSVEDEGDNYGVNSFIGMTTWRPFFPVATSRQRWCRHHGIISSSLFSVLLWLDLTTMKD